MINKIWAYMIIISILFGVLNGRIHDVNNAIFLSFENTTEMILSITSIMCFWCGMIEILKSTRILNFFNKILNPFVNYFFARTSKIAKDAILINIFSNILGIGNAATPSGIKAMKEMENDCQKDSMSTEMNLFILMNTLSIQIFPTTIISILISSGNIHAGKIILPIIITSFTTFFIIMFLGKYILKGNEEKF